MPSETRCRVRRSVVSAPETGQYCLGIGRPVTLSVNDCSRVPSPPARTIAALWIRVFTRALIRGSTRAELLWVLRLVQLEPVPLANATPESLRGCGSAINLSKDIACGLAKGLAVRAAAGSD